MNTLRRYGWLAASASVLLFGTMTFAQTSTTSDAQTSGKAKHQTSAEMGKNNDSARTGGVPAKDNHFIQNAAQGGVAEVEMGKLAQQNGQSQDVKDFGKRMVDDHTKANDQLKQLASQKGVSIPDGPNAKDKSDIDRLSKLKADAFDKAYMKEMVSDHKKDVAEFQREANSGRDPDVKNWAGQTLPTLQDHLKMAQQYAGQNKSGNAKSNSMSNKKDAAAQQQ